MFKRYFAWTTTGDLVALGECEDFDAASAKEPNHTLWIFGEPDLIEFQNKIIEVLAHSVSL